MRFALLQHPHYTRENPRWRECPYCSVLVRQDEQTAHLITPECIAAQHALRSK